MMRKILKGIFVLALGTGRLFSQESGETKETKEGRLDFTANIQNNHLWRGLIITDKPVVMGNLSYALDAEKKWKVGIWGASALADDKDNTHYKEINYYVQYSNGRFYIGLWDLYNSRNINTAVAADDIFSYSQRRTAHIIDLRTNYTFGPSFPINIEADIMLYGGANAGEVILEPDGSYKKNRYSTYVQASYPVISGQKVNLDAFVGAGFSLNGNTFLYGNGKNNFDIVNVGAKQAIARAALSLIHENDCIILASGTTMHYLARMLMNFGPLTVLTSSLRVAIELCNNPNINVIQLGGEVNKELINILLPIQ